MNDLAAYAPGLRSGPNLRFEADRVTAGQDVVLGANVEIRARSLVLGDGVRIGDDVVILGFGGEPLRPLSEWRLKHPPMKDVAGMLRSFHYAAYAGLFTQIPQDKSADQQRLAALEPWARWWWQGVATVFLTSYLPNRRRKMGIDVDDIAGSEAARPHHQRKHHERRGPDGEE